MPEGNVLFWRNSEVVTLRHDNELRYWAVCTRVTERNAENKGSIIFYVFPKFEILSVLEKRKNT